jgi:hypothetical protein
MCKSDYSISFYLEKNIKYIDYYINNIYLHLTTSSAITLLETRNLLSIKPKHDQTMTDRIVMIVGCKPLFKTI